MSGENDPTQPGVDDEVIEGFYDWGPGVVVTADCLGQSYETSLAGRPLIVTVPAFDGSALAEPPLRYTRPDSYVDVDPPHPWGGSCVAGTRPKTGR